MKQPIGPLPENIEELINTVVYDNIKQFESGQGNRPSSPIIGCFDKIGSAANVGSQLGPTKF
jgi:hypothetical protein